jgi:hypothetical protein
MKSEGWQVEDEQREEQETHIQAYIRLPPKQVHQVGSKDQAMKRSRSPMRQDRREQPKQAKPEAKGKRVAVEVYDTRVSQSPHFTHPFGHPGVSSSTSFPGS